MALLGLGVAPCLASAQVRPSTVQLRPVNLVEGRVLMAMPASMPTGMATGIEATFTRTLRRWLAWGARVSWSTATEYTSDDWSGWEVRHDEIRLRGLALLRREVGRTTLALRLGVGATLVHQGLTRMLPAPPHGGMPRETVPDDHPAPGEDGWELLPAFELEPAVTLRLLGGWGVSLGGGPSLHIVDGSARWGWTSGLGVAWQR